MTVWNILHIISFKIRMVNMQTKEIRLENLPEAARIELYDFYEFLASKYGKKTVAVSKKKIFLESVARHSFKLPAGYKFNREEIYER